MFIELTAKGGEDMVAINVNHIVAVFGGSEVGTAVRLSAPDNQGLYEIEVEELAGEIVKQLVLMGK